MGFQNFVGIDSPPIRARDHSSTRTCSPRASSLRERFRTSGRGPASRPRWDLFFQTLMRIVVLAIMRCGRVQTLGGGVAVHVNNWFELSRCSLHADWFEGMIVEGTVVASARRVSEWFIEHEFVADVTTVSGLVGAVWQTHDARRPRHGPARGTRR